MHSTRYQGAIIRDHHVLLLKQIEHASGRSYGKYLVSIAAHKKHIRLYSAPPGVEEFHEAVALYGGGNGTLKYQLNKPMPFDLIRRVVRFRAKEQADKAAAKQN